MRAIHNGIKEYWRRMVNRDVNAGLECGEIDAFLKPTQHVIGVIVLDEDHGEAHLTLRYDVKGSLTMADSIVDVQHLLGLYYERYFTREYHEAAERTLKELENDNA